MSCVLSCVLSGVSCAPFQLTANTAEDYDLKFKLLNDMLDIIDMENRCGGGHISTHAHVPPPSTSTLPYPTLAVARCWHVVVVGPAG